MIENPPKFTNYNVLNFLENPANKKYIDKVNNEYFYWDKAKYLAPKDVSPEEFWSAVKYTRFGKKLKFGNYVFQFKETDLIFELLHEFDMNFGGIFTSENIISDRNRQYYLLSSIMEEAIASSQMEGASTTRKVAKDMLRRQVKPKDKSQQMIVNNYNTIRYLSEHKDEDLSTELILKIHSSITEKTLDNPNEESHFRTSDNIYVVNGITGEIAHDPPSYKEIGSFVSSLCNFANKDDVFIHPILKAIIIHFMISYLHPFSDGNGRTARSLFYWYMLKKGYWVTEFLSISRIIYKSKSQYEKVFLYTEHDDFDLNYFILYNLKILKKAFEELKIYQTRKSQENNALLEYRIPGLNERQIQIVKFYIEKPTSVFISKDFETRFNVSVKTIRSDLESLSKKGLLEKILLNKRLVGYIKSGEFDSILAENRGN